MELMLSAYIYNGIPFSYKKKGSAGTCSMDESRLHAKQEKPDIKCHILFDSRHISRIGKSIENTDWWVPGAGGRKTRKQLLSGYRVSFRGNVSEQWWLHNSEYTKCP